MKRIQTWLSAAFCPTVLAGLLGCGPARAQEPPDGITIGTRVQRGFLNDNVYHSELGAFAFFINSHTFIVQTAQK